MDHNQEISEIIYQSKINKLKFLDLSNKNLSIFPIELCELDFLEGLDISNNNIDSIPAEILKMSNLKDITINGNPITKPPIEIANQGIETIKNYYYELDRIGIDYLYEAKLLIVGEGGAGKTSLARKLIDHNAKLPTENESTHGIDINSFNFPLDDDRDFRVNLWDFGGQEIYHSTHSFFLTKRSLYVLVADSRNEHTNFNYWLNLVELLSDSSPVIIVINEKNDRAKDIDEYWIKGRFGNVARILKGNLLTNRGLEAIVNEIKHQISQLPHVGSPLPKVWKNIKIQLQSLDKNYIFSNNYLQLCQENGIDDNNQALMLSQYFHDLGIFLHFQDNIILKRMINLKPEWATSAVYSIIENVSIIKNTGKFTIDNVNNIWKNLDYKELSDELLELMVKFEICYKVDNNNYIVPQLLPYSSPKYNWDNTNNVIIKYKYDFMPKGILTRFTVRMSRYVESDFVWKSGVILKKDDTFAEIIEFYGSNEIIVKINGSGKQELLTLINEEFNLIHKTYHKLNVKTLIPCNCSVCTNLKQPNFYEYSSLIRRLKNGKLVVECEISYEDVSVKNLITDVGYSQKEQDAIFNTVLKDFGLNIKMIKENNNEI